MTTATPRPATPLFGSLVRARTLPGVRLSETHHPADERIPPHRHAAPFVTFVLRGGYDEIRSGQAARCRPGCAVLHEAGEIHADRFGGRESLLLNVEWEPTEDDLPAWRPQVAEGPAPRRIAATLAAELRCGDGASRLVIESSLAEIAMLGHLATPTRRGNPPWLRRVEERLRDEYRDPPSLADLARDAGVHRSHLARSFRHRYGRTVGEFVRELRIGWARERLRRGAVISEVAHAAGFADQSHMTRWFKRSLGVPPGRIRAS